MSIHCFQRANTGQSHGGALNQACRGIYFDEKIKDEQNKICDNARNG